MMQIPPWNAVHPLVVHFPIALLLCAWMPMVGGLIDRRRRWGWLFAGMLLLVVGTAFAFVAVLSGEASEHAVASVVQPEAREAIERHGELGELARTLFVLVTVWGGLTLSTTRLPKRVRRAALPITSVVFVVGYAGAGWTLVRAGHAGGEVVHAWGVQAPLPAPMPDEP